MVTWVTLLTIIRLIFCLATYLTKANGIECKYKDGICIFSNVRKTEKDPLFEPTVPNGESADKVIEVAFIKSELYVLTDELCDKFNNLETLDISSVNLKEVDGSAFYNCTALKIINLSFNRLESLDFFSIKEFGTLTHFHLHNNSLQDIDEESIVYKFINLSHITIDNNDLDCNRLRAIIGLFQRYDLNFASAEMPTYSANLSYIEGISCYPEVIRIRKIVAPMVTEEVDETLSTIDAINKNVTYIEANQTANDKDLNIMNETFINFSSTFDLNITDIKECILGNNLTVQNISLTAEEMATDIPGLQKTINEHDEGIKTVNETISGFRFTAEQFETELEDLEDNIIKKTNYSGKIYYITVILIVIVTLIAVVVLGVLVHIFCFSKLKKGFSKL